MERIIKQLAAEDIHGIADDDVTGMDGFAANLGGSEGFGLGEVLAKVKALGMSRGVMRPYPHPRSAEYITGLAPFVVASGVWSMRRRLRWY